jgi:MFS family permease
LRFLLGIAEAGFFPGIILYLTYWYPSHRRARMIALFMAAIPLSGIVGGPLSGWIMKAFAGFHNLTGWQWLFVLEAIPALAIGVITMIYLDNGVRSAKWLNEDEKRILEANLARDQRVTPVHPSFSALASDRRLWRMCLIYFASVVGNYGLTFWLPSLIAAAGVTDVLRIGLWTAVPYSVAIIFMLILGRSADRRRERRWHTAVPMLMGAIGLTGSALVGAHTIPAMVFLTIAACGLMTCAPLFWSLPTAILQGTAAAAGIAAINSIGNLGGFVSPYVVGGLKDLTHSTALGMYVLSAVLVLGSALIISLPAKMVNR